MYANHRNTICFHSRSHRARYHIGHYWASCPTIAGSLGPDEEVEHQVSAGTDPCVCDTKQRQELEAGSSTLKHHSTSAKPCSRFQARIMNQETHGSFLRLCTAKKVSTVNTNSWSKEIWPFEGNRNNGSLTVWWKNPRNLSGPQANLHITLAIVSLSIVTTCIMNKAPHDSLQFFFFPDIVYSELLEFIFIHSDHECSKIYTVQYIFISIPWTPYIHTIYINYCIYI